MIKKIKDRSLEFRKSKDINSKLYSTLLSEVLAEAKKENREPVDADFILVIKKIVKNNTNFINSIKDKSKIEELTSENNELTQWLPKQLTEDELENIINELKPTNIGLAMKYLKENYDGRYDGKIASLVFRRFINS